MSLEQKNNKGTNPFKNAPFKSDQNPSFTSDPTYMFEKVQSSSTITYKNINKITEAIDSILGKDGYFAQKIQDAGLSTANNMITVDKNTLLGDIFSTIKYPFVDMPFDIINWLCKCLKKTPLRPLGSAIANLGFIKERTQKIESQRSYELVKKILEQFCTTDNGDVSKLGSAFAQSSADKITKTAKNYASRDERTLNRIATATVGGILSSKDMYNISMLEKNDKEEAKKAEKDRLSQELSRVGISASLTFLSLGALNKYTKNNVVLSAIVIAGSALAAEIISRVRKHKSLIPLTPEKARKIALKQEENKKHTSIPVVETTIKNLDKKDTNNLYKDFIRDIHITTTVQKEVIKPEETQNNNTQKPKKKNRHILLKVAVASLMASAIYLTSRFTKGEYAAKVARRQLLSEYSDKINTYLQDTADAFLDRDIIDRIDDTLMMNNPKTHKKNVFVILENFKKKITKKSTEVDVVHLEDEINNLLAAEGTQNVAPVLGIYKNHIQLLKEGGELRFSEKVTRIVPNAIFEGFTKIFKTAYTILSAPGQFINNKINKHYEDSEKIFKEVEAKLETQYPARLKGKYKEELAELNELFKRHNNRRNKYQKITQLLQTHVRNFEESAETGDLANLARTLVTMISSWFYVNDFRNTVLIESKGENTQRANEVMNESIGFKVANFFFNGTIMNLGNSIFKETLNGSLFGATIIATCEEIINEFLIRKTICRPMGRLESREAVIEYEHARASKKGPMGAWTRFFKKITGQKSLIEKYNAQQTKKK